MDCLFCRIAKGELKATIYEQNDQLIAFADIEPVAPTHFLVIPKRHIATLNELQAKDTDLIGQMIIFGSNLAKKQGLHSYRLVMNCNADAGQSVFHIHLHVIGGQKMGWPPFSKDENLNDK